MWQATVQQAPPGRAALLLGGDGLGLRGIDLLDHEGKVAVVGRDGSYRMLLYHGAAVVPGEDVLLSPDGRYVVQSFVAGGPRGFLVVTDLTDGTSRALPGPQGRDCCGQPVAWAPDGRAVLALELPREPIGWDPITQIGVLPARPVLINLESKSATPLLDTVGDVHRLRTASLAAFSPDGKRIALRAGDQLHLVDRAGRTLWTATLGERRHLAGLGAFSPDGTRIATVTLDGCLRSCDTAALASRTWHVGYLDAATGQDTSGPAVDTVRGMALRVLGWRGGTDLVALRYQPERGAYSEGPVGWNDTGWWETGEVTLVALRPGGGTEILIDSPGEILAMDVPRDLLEAGRFGGPSHPPAPFPARPVILAVLVPAAVPVIAAVCGLLLWWRRRRRRSPRRGDAAAHVGGV